jgi:hypothetical protein
MKKLFLIAFLFLGFQSNAQIGVVTINENDSIPIGQWYNVSGDLYNNKVFYFNNNTETELILEEVLSPWGLYFEDGEIDEEGDFFWVVDNENGYTSTVYLIYDDEEQSVITIVTEEN